MIEQDTVSTLTDYERVSKIANDLYKEAENLAGLNEELFIERLIDCARLEEEAFHLSEEAGVGSLIRDTHARYVVQNFFRAGLYSDVIRFGKKVVLLLQDPGSQKTVDQVNLYINAAREKILTPQPLP